METVAAFTDTYLPTVNGVSYTISTWRQRWRERGGRMDVVYPRDSGHAPDETEHPVASVVFPFYDDFRLGPPRIPAGLDGTDVVHAHTPFGLGIGGLRLARKHDAPLAASYHTPAAEYANYLTSSDRVERRIRAIAQRYECWFYDRADVVITPTESTKRHVRERVGVRTPVEVVSNGVDTDRFQPSDGAALRRRYDLGAGPLVGYTGRHGHEKRLGDLLRAVDGTDLTAVIAGDGPARPELERLAADLDGDVRFLGFLDRDELSAFYSALDVFAFPSPVETQGLVALEANACGTPVVGVNSGALAETIEDDVTGFHVPVGDVAAFRDAIQRALAERERLAENCLERREASSVDRSVDRLAEIYEGLG